MAILQAPTAENLPLLRTQAPRFYNHLQPSRRPYGTRVETLCQPGRSQVRPL